jgi:hypothetical protein
MSEDEKLRFASRSLRAEGASARSSGRSMYTSESSIGFLLGGDERPMPSDADAQSGDAICVPLTRPAAEAWRGS